MAKDARTRAPPSSAASDCIIYSFSLFLSLSFFFSLADGRTTHCPIGVSERLSRPGREGRRNPGIPFPSSPPLSLSLSLSTPLPKCHNGLVVPLLSDPSAPPPQPSLTTVMYELD